MPISPSGQFDDVDNSSYLATSINVSTTQTELKVGASRLEGRQTIIIINKGNQTIFVGPSGVTATTGISLAKDQMLTLPFGDNIAVYAITSSGTSATVVQEVG